jgi:hypothetical protein
MEYTKTVKISQAQADYWDKVLKEGYDPNYKRIDPIEIITVDLGDDVLIDLKLVNGEPSFDSAPGQHNSCWRGLHRPCSVR